VKDSLVDAHNLNRFITSRIESFVQRHQISGSKISFVGQEACTEAIARAGRLKRLYLLDLLKYADMEEPWGNRVHKSIGF